MNISKYICYKMLTVMCIRREVVCGSDVSSSPGKNAEVGGCFILQGIFLTEGLNTCLF